MKSKSLHTVFFDPKRNASKIHFVFFFVAFLILLSLSKTTYAQEPLRINFEAYHLSLSELLNKLYTEQKINLAFSSDEMNAATKLSYTAKSKTVEEILNDILLPNGYNFKKIGSQYVIFKEEKLQLISIEPKQKQPVVVENESPQQQSEDTIVFQSTFVTDTIVRVDTIIRVDTLLIRDTITREVRVRDNRSQRRFLIHASQRAEKGFSLQVAYSQVYTNYLVRAKDAGETIAQLYEDALILSWQNQSLAVGGVYSQNRFAYSVLLGLTSLRHNFKYTNTVVHGGYYQTDTLDMYYSIVGNDTIWVAVTDSTYIPRTENTVDYRSFNRLLLLNACIDVRYNMIHKPDFKLYSGAGLGFYYVMDYEITVLGVEEKMPLKDVDIQKFGLSYNLKLGSQIAISRHLDINAEIYYKQSLNSLLKNYPVDVRLFGVGLQIGFIYHFH